MDKTPLVDRDIETGRCLVQALDQSGFPLTAAMWNYLPEEEDWRLVLASPQVGDRGPRETYAAVQDVLSHSGIDLPLHRISVVEPEEHPIADLRIFAGTEPAPFVGGTHLRGTAIGGVYLESAYVYRAERIIGKTGEFTLLAAVLDKASDIWIGRPCKVTVSEGFFQKIEGEGFAIPQSRSRQGINARLWILENTQEHGGEVLGDVLQWTIHGGRLRSRDRIARGVKVEYRDAPSAEPASK